MAAAVVYGVIHDQITARICVEYFTKAHFYIGIADPTLLGFFWGIVGTWWVGLFLGVPLAIVSTFGKKPKIRAIDLVDSICRLLVSMFAIAVLAGGISYLLAAQGQVRINPAYINVIPPGAYNAFIAVSGAHLASYLTGGCGGILIILSVWKKRCKLFQSSLES